MRDCSEAGSIASTADILLSVTRCRVNSIIGEPNRLAVTVVNSLTVYICLLALIAGCTVYSSQRERHKTGNVTRLLRSEIPYRDNKETPSTRQTT